MAATIADIPTIEYIILDNTDIFPNIAATKSKSKNPTNPQFMPPIINIVNDRKNSFSFDIIFTTLVNNYHL